MMDNLCAICQEHPRLGDLWVCDPCFDQEKWPCIPIPLPCLFPQKYGTYPEDAALEKSYQLIRYGSEGEEEPTEGLKKLKIQKALSGMRLTKVISETFRKQMSDFDKKNFLTGDEVKSND
jgi:hypothetical protein